MRCDDCQASLEQRPGESPAPCTPHPHSLSLALCLPFPTQFRLMLSECRWTDVDKAALKRVSQQGSNLASHPSLCHCQGQGQGQGQGQTTSFPSCSSRLACNSASTVRVDCQLPCCLQLPQIQDTLTIEVQLNVCVSVCLYECVLVTVCAYVYVCVLPIVLRLLLLLLLPLLPHSKCATLWLRCLSPPPRCRLKCPSLDR